MTERIKYEFSAVSADPVEAQWDEAAYAEVSSDLPVQYSEVQLSGTATQEKEGRLFKGILRTGHWDTTPTTNGKLKKPLTIIRDGKGDPEKGIIALSELVENFRAKKGVKKVLVPFSDKKSDDHVRDGNLARVNTGFVEDIFIEDDGDVSHLIGEFRMTDGDVKKMVLDGSVDDVSSGIPWHPVHGGFLEHVALTPNPFIDGQRPWLAASDAPQVVKDAEITVFSLVETETPVAEEEAVAEPTETLEAPEAVELTLSQLIEKSAEALKSQFNMTDDYVVTGALGAGSVIVVNEVADKTWTVPYTTEDDKVLLADFAAWDEVKKDVENSLPSVEDESSESDLREEVEMTSLEAAGKLREMRFAASAQSPKAPTKGGGNMTVVPTPEELAKLEVQLSDEQKVIFQNLMAANAEAAAKNREADVDARILEIEGYGFSDRPGFLKLYRNVALADDAMPAAVLLSDDGTEETITALEILDRAVEALRGAEGTITFSDQHLESGNDEKPPVDGGETKSVEERVAEARAFLNPNGK